MFRLSSLQEALLAWLEVALHTHAHTCYIGVTMVLYWRHIGVTMVLQWCYSGVTSFACQVCKRHCWPGWMYHYTHTHTYIYNSVTIVLQWCYNGVTVVSQWCYNGVTVVLQWCYIFRLSSLQEALLAWLEVAVHTHMHIYGGVTMVLYWCYSVVTCFACRV
jgi:hypothetical protein